MSEATVLEDEEELLLLELVRLATVLELELEDDELELVRLATVEELLLELLEELSSPVPLTSIAARECVCPVGALSPTAYVPTEPASA